MQAKRRTGSLTRRDKQEFQGVRHNQQWFCLLVFSGGIDAIRTSYGVNSALACDVKHELNSQPIEQKQLTVRFGCWLAETGPAASPQVASPQAQPRRPVAYQSPLRVPHE